MIGLSSTEYRAVKKAIQQDTQLEIPIPLTTEHCSLISLRPVGRPFPAWTAFPTVPVNLRRKTPPTGNNHSSWFTSIAARRWNDFLKVEPRLHVHYGGTPYWPEVASSGFITGVVLVFLLLVNAVSSVPPQSLIHTPDRQHRMIMYARHHLFVASLAIDWRTSERICKPFARADHAVGTQGMAALISE
jgi:hypothetical protein